MAEVTIKTFNETKTIKTVEDVSVTINDGKTEVTTRFSSPYGKPRFEVWKDSTLLVRGSRRSHDKSFKIFDLTTGFPPGMIRPPKMLGTLAITTTEGVVKLPDPSRFVEDDVMATFYAVMKGDFCALILSAETISGEWPHGLTVKEVNRKVIAVFKKVGEGLWERVSSPRKEGSNGQEV